MYDHGLLNLDLYPLYTLRKGTFQLAARYAGSEEDFLINGYFGTDTGATVVRFVGGIQPLSYAIVGPPPTTSFPYGLPVEPDR